MTTTPTAVKLSEAQRELLTLFSRGSRDGFAPGNRTLAILIERGFVERFSEKNTYGQPCKSWRITDAGRLALEQNK